MREVCCRLCGTVCDERVRRLGKSWWSASGNLQSSISAGEFTLEFGSRTVIMGVINATPDSFSGDGVGTDIEAAIGRAKAHVAAGASIVDVGGESTRPGAEPVSEETECSRVIPVIEALRYEIDVPVSIDTRKAVVAEAAINAGAVIVNDIWGLRGDPAMADVVARYPYTALIVMHNQGGTEYADLVSDILSCFRESIDIAEHHGIREERIVIDPGFGFGKTAAQNVEIVGRLHEFRAVGRPIAIGIARKSTVGAILNGAPLEMRLEASLALTALAIGHGADLVRTNDVDSTVRACRAADEVVHGPSVDLMAQRPPGYTL